MMPNTSPEETGNQRGELAASPIRVFNTLTGRKEELVSLHPGELGIYVCGPTVYSCIHIGNARTFTVFDMMVRYLRYRGLRVTYVRNFTDVDDKIIEAARQAGEDPASLSAHFIDEFQSDARALGLLEPDVSPKVTDHMPDIIKLIERLVERGVAYESGGDVYFAVARYPGYAKLSKRNVSELRAGERVQLGEHKRDPLDFALWKAAKPGEPAWDSPWGKGRPGWHIECSAMAARYLGESFDVHGGGMDLIFPHHENEIAQSEAAFDKPFSRYWMHCGFLDLEGAKMSKSLGNVVRLRDALGKVDAQALRLFFLSTHYRHSLEFSDKSLFDAEARLQYFYETLLKVDEQIAGKDFGTGPMHGDPNSYLRQFETAMDDDFNTAAALAVLSGLFAAMNALADKPPIKDRAMVGRTLAALRALARIIGSAMALANSDPGTWLMARRDRAVKQRGIDPVRVEALIAERSRARACKDFGEADRLRDELRDLGIEVTDKPNQTTWRVAS
jgi:cysteinyl-tRNA synthetase